MLDRKPSWTPEEVVGFGLKGEWDAAMVIAVRDGFVYAFTSQGMLVSDQIWMLERAKRLAFEDEDRKLSTRKR
jgi:hypothetical protein